ncbi:hypothetical protein PG988_006522 [Apiospora saccharicola]
MRVSPGSGSSSVAAQCSINGVLSGAFMNTFFSILYSPLLTQITLSRPLNSDKLGNATTNSSFTSGSLGKRPPLIVEFGCWFLAFLLSLRWYEVRILFLRGHVIAIGILILAVALATGLAVALVTGLAVALATGLAVALATGLAVALVTGLAVALATGLAVALVTGLAVALVTGLAVALVTGLAVALVTGLAVALITGLAVALATGLVVELAVSKAINIIV